VVLLFAFLDLILVPKKYWGLFLTVRLASSVILLLIYRLAHSSYGKRRPAIFGIAGTVVVGGMISLMTRYLGGYQSTYYAGLNLLILSVTLFLPLSLLESLVTCGLIYTTYLVPIFLRDQIARPDVFINHNFFLSGTIVIALLNSFYNQRSRYREFRYRYELARTNENLIASAQEKIRFFSNLGRLISSSLDWQGVVLSALKLMREGMGLQLVACFPVDGNQQLLGRPITEDNDEGLTARLNRAGALLQQLLDTPSDLYHGEPLVLSRETIPERDKLKRGILDLLETGTLAILPLKEKGRVSCIFLADLPSANAETGAEQLQLLAHFTNPISAALEKAHLFEREMKRTSQLLLIHEISRTMASILDFKAVCREFSNLLQREFGYEHVSVYRVDDRNHLVLSGLKDLRPDLLVPEEFPPSAKNSLCQAQATSKTILMRAEQEALELEECLHPGARSRLCIPYSHSTRVLGVIDIESEKDHSFDKQDITVLETLSDYLAIWLNNANLYTDLGRKAGALQTLNHIGRAISSELNINNLFELIYRQVGQVLPGEDFLIGLRERGTHQIEVKFEVVDGKRKRHMSNLSHDGLVSYVMQTQVPLLIKEDFDKVYKSITRRTPHRIAQSWLGVPLILGDESIGVVVLQNFRIRQDYDNDDLNFLSTIADQAAVAIANARLFREAQERATRLAVVNEITREASLKLDVDKLFERINKELKRVILFEKSSIAIYQPDSDTFSLLNVYGENITTGFYRGMEIPGRETVMRIAHDTKQPYYTRNLDRVISHTSPYLITQGIQSAVSVPIISEDVCLGTLNLGSQKEDGFSDDQIELLKTIANSLGTALKNARLYSALEQSYMELQSTQEQLIKSEKLRALGEMSAGVAHDFNNILGAILGRAQLMKSQSPDATVLRGLEIIEKAAIDGAATVRRLQDYTRKRTDQVFSQVDLIQVVEDTLSMTRTRWEDSAHISGIQYSITTQYEPIPPVAGDSSELREVFTNVIFNALDAMPNGGKIHIRAWSEDHQVRVTVTDTGRGMTEEIRQKVFDPFFTTKGVKGNGLGMSVAYGIITRHKGAIELSSELGKGTSVSINIPVSLNADHQANPSKPTARKRTGRFLIIDDEAPIRDLLAEILSEQGHMVYTASGGKEGLEIFKAQSLDMVITDLGMPEISGWDVANAVKVLNPGISVILMTGWGITLDRAKAKERGVDVIVSKPFQISEIQKVLNEMLELQV
jgi:signal transduction histidine kinase